VKAIRCALTAPALLLVVQACGGPPGVGAAPPVAARLVTVRGAGPTPSPTPSTALSRVLTTREI